MISERFPFEMEKYSKNAKRGKKSREITRDGTIVDISFSLWVATMMITFYAMINPVIASKPQFAREAGEKVCSVETANAVPISGRRKLPKSRRHPRKRRYKVNKGGKNIDENIVPSSLSLFLFLLLN